MKTNGKEFLSAHQFSELLRKARLDPDWQKTNQFKPENWADVNFEFKLAQWRDIKNLSLLNVQNTLRKNGFSFSYQYIQKVENNLISPSYDFLYAMKTVFGLSIDEIFFPEKKLRKKRKIIKATVKDQEKNE